MEAWVHLGKSQTFKHRVQLILIICRFHPCKFVYSLKSLCNPQISTHGTFLDMCGAVRKSSPQKVRSQPRWNKATFCLLVSALILPTSVFCMVYLVSCLSHFFLFFFFCVFLVILLFKMTPKLRLKCCLLFLSAGKL